MEFDNHKMIEMPEQPRRYQSVAYERAQAGPSEGYGMPQIERKPVAQPPIQQNFEAPPEPTFDPPREPHEPHIATASEHPSHPAPDYESDAGNDYAKYPPQATQSISIWRRRKLGHSIRFWSLVALGLLITVALIAGLTAGLVIRHKRESEYDGDYREPAPFQPRNLTLNCPSINQQITNTTSNITYYSNYYYENERNLANGTFQFKQFCNKGAILESSNLTQITYTGDIDEEDDFLTTPSTANSLYDCVQSCIRYTLNVGTTAPCFGAWFNADETVMAEEEFEYNDNCYLYSMDRSEGLVALSDILVPTGGRTAMAVMVSWNNDTFVGSYLSNNGDWSGGTNHTGVII